MNNKLDSFNKDKRKCKKCKEYYENDTLYPQSKLLCRDCHEKWDRFWVKIPIISWDKVWRDWCDNEQT
jgi:hypothetical protein